MFEYFWTVRNVLGRHDCITYNRKSCDPTDRFTRSAARKKVVNVKMFGRSHCAGNQNLPLRIDSHLLSKHTGVVSKCNTGIRNVRSRQTL